MSKNAYITEAFKQFGTLMEEEAQGRLDAPFSQTGFDDARSFIDEMSGEEEPLDVIDLEAEAEEDLKQSYVGKVILDCNVCHSNLFIDKEEVFVDEADLANVDLECPYCMSNEGYVIIGQVEPYSETESVPVDDIEDDIDDVELPVEDEEDIIEESVDKSGTEKMKGSDKIGGVKSLNSKKEMSGVEDIAGHKLDANLHEDVTITATTPDNTVTVNTTDSGDVVVDSDATEGEEDSFEMDPMLRDGDEYITPLSDENESEIQANSEEELEGEEAPDTTEEDEFMVDEFDEETFDQLGESYLKKIYENVSSFKTIAAQSSNNKLVVEGLINFNSGATKGTSFIFEAVGINKNNKTVKFEGFNNQISKGKKTFKLNCSINEGVLSPQSLNYNYQTRNELNESVKVYGTVKK